MLMEGTQLMLTAQKSHFVCQGQLVIRKVGSKERVCCEIALRSNVCEIFKKKERLFLNFE